MVMDFFEKLEYKNALFIEDVNSDDISRFINCFTRMNQIERLNAVEQWKKHIDYMAKKDLLLVLDCLINNYFLSERDVKEEIISFFELILLKKVNIQKDIVKYLDILIVEVDLTFRKRIVDIFNQVLCNCIEENKRDLINRNYDFLTDLQLKGEYNYNSQILFIVPYFLQRKGFLQPPIDVLVSATILKKLGYSVSILDLRTDKLDITRCKINSDVIFVSMCPYDIIQNYPVDYKFENTVSLINYLSREKEYNVIAYGPYIEVDDKINEICFPNKFIYGHIENAIVSECNQLFGKHLLFDDIEMVDIVPDYDLVDLTKYYLYEESKVSPWVAVLANRGCPYDCKFCYDYFEKKQKIRSAKSVIEELSILEKRYNVKKCIFLDSTFTFNIKWLNEFCDIYNRRQLSIEWQMETRIDCLDEWVLNLVMNANCSKIFIGVESLDDKMLKFLSKRISVQQIHEKIELLNTHNIDYELFLMAGLPFQTIEDLYIEYDMLNKWGVKKYQFIVFMPRPNTDLYELACQEYPFLRDDIRYISCVRGCVKNNINGLELQKFLSFARRG